MSWKPHEYAPPPLREQISLNGTWDNGEQVPRYDWQSFDERTYSRTVDVPAAWSNRVVRLEFEAVNFSCELFVNDRLVGRHVGGWVPFAVDVSDAVTPGESFSLRLEVKGRRLPPYADGEGYPRWPVGQPSQPELDSRFAGIVDTVWLRAYGEVHLEDAFIQPSWRERQLVVDYTLVNSSAEDRELRIVAEAIAEDDGTVAGSFEGPKVSLRPGERKRVRAVYAWNDARLWWPDDPFLYGLRTRLVDSAAEDTILDQEQRRFGFREIWIEGNQYVMNGVRINLFGDYTLYGQERYWPGEHGPEVFAGTIRKLKDLNIRILRWHKQPPPRFTLDMTDALGLLVCAESAINGAEGNTIWQHIDRAAFKANAMRWIEPWVRGSRNHPSLVIWSAENEFGAYHQRVFADIQTRGLGRAIEALDPTRSVCYDGDQEVGGATINYHYPEGYDRVPSGSIYSWAPLVYADKPTGLGEVLHIGAELEPTIEKQRVYERNKWHLGFWLRGWRYCGFTDVRPAIYRWARKELAAHRVDLIRKAMAPVALFDKHY
ncbi:MAG: hypothetical protein GF393_11705, partial [Armatimonadia bacterium]|nr:hypothetical protein [Armatimonadia bacterium]